MNPDVTHGVYIFHHILLVTGAHREKGTASDSRCPMRSRSIRASSWQRVISILLRPVWLNHFEIPYCIKRFLPLLIKIGVACHFQHVGCCCGLEVVDVTTGSGAGGHNQCLPVFSIHRLCLARPSIFGNSLGICYISILSKEENDTIWDPLTGEQSVLALHLQSMSSSPMLVTISI